MSFTACLLASASRALGAALLAWLLAQPVVALRRRRAAVALLGIVLLTPALLVAHTWGERTVGWPGREAVLVLLLAMRGMPVAVIALWLAPAPPMSASAEHCLRLAPALPRWRAALWRLRHGSGRRHLVALIAVFLLAFQDFELASLMAGPAWTVWLFDAQAGGLPLGRTFAMAIGPVALEIAVVVGGLRLLAPGIASSGIASSGIAVRATASPPDGRRHGIAGWLVLSLVLAVVVAAPAATLLVGSLAGLARVVGDGALRQEIGAGMLAAAIAAAGAVVVARAALRCRRPAVVVVVCVPGLGGAMAGGLILQAAFQLPGLAWLYDTPAPLLLGQVLLAVPLAVVLLLVLEGRRPLPAGHLAALLQGARDARVQAAGRRLRWVLGSRAPVVVGVLCFTLLYFEVVLGALLAPVAFTPVALRLYNLMHYGESTVLSAMVVVACLTPCLLAGALALVLTFGSRQAWRGRPA